MTDTASLEEILSKFAGNKIDSKEFLNLLLTSDENGMDYLQSLKKDFKENYVNPVFKKVTDHYKKLDNELKNEKKKEKVIKEINDPLDLINLNKEYKKKAKKLLDKQIENLSSNLKTSSDVPNIENKGLSAILPKTSSDVPNIENKGLSAILPKNTPEINQEQKTFTKENVVSLSEKTINKLADIFGGLQSSKVKKDENATPQDGGFSLSGLAGLLLAGGLAAGAIGIFWDSHIKPWLEEKLGSKLDFLDRFEGTLEGIAKFFTLGGLKLSGAGIIGNLVGKAFTTFGELLESSLSAIFKLGFGDDVVKAGAQAAPSVWKTLIPKVVGGLFKGAGLVAFKAIPIIGSLISFYFAYDRFQKNDYIGGIIDIANGLVGFIPGAGIPLSLGLSALNAFLDYKAGDIKDVGAQQSMKMDFLGKIVNFIREIPIVGGLVSGLMGLWKLGTASNINDVKQALDDMEAVPIFGLLPSILRSVLDVTFNDEGEWQGYDFGKVIKNIKTDMLKTILKWFPEWFGVRATIADLMGIKLDGTPNDPFSDAEIASGENKITPEALKELRERKQKLLKDKEIAKKNIEENKQKHEEKSFVDRIIAHASMDRNVRAKSIAAQRSDELLEMTNKTIDEELSKIDETLDKVNEEAKKTFDERMESIKDPLNIKLDKNPFDASQNVENSQTFTRINEKKQQDFSFRNLMGTSQSSILFDKSTNTANLLDKEDNILAYKKDGVFDLALQEITKLVSSINKGIYMIPESLENMPQTPVVVNSGGGETTDNSMAFVLGGARDPIYEFRRSIRS